MVLLVYTTYISVDLAHHEIFCAKVGKGGINSSINGNRMVKFKEIKMIIRIGSYSNCCCLS